jgi:hypothetical protein
MINCNLITVCRETSGDQPFGSKPRHAETQITEKADETMCHGLSGLKDSGSPSLEALAMLFVSPVQSSFPISSISQILRSMFGMQRRLS